MDVVDDATGLSISQVSERTGLSQHTLRWYERIGLVRPVARGGSGRRRYTQQDLDWLRLFTKLRATGMSVADMLRYAELARAGASTYDQRRELLEEHREQVREAIAVRQDMLSLLDHKIENYRACTLTRDLAGDGDGADDAQSESRGA